jgi:diguanylate cyclase (GGDEF)-like protein/PAS domain S-box-containing protein
MPDPRDIPEYGALLNPQSDEFQRSLLSAILSSSPNGILVVDHAGRLVFHNSRLFEVWGWQPENMREHAIGNADSPLLAKALQSVKDPEAFAARVRELYAQPDLLDNCEIELRNGRVLDRHSKSLRGKQGEYMGRVWFFRDITEYKQAEQRLRESENRFRQMFESNDAVMLLIEPASGNIIDANRAAANFYGYPVTQMREMCIDQINMLPPDKIAEERQRSLHQKRNYFIFPHRLANGEARTVEVHSSPIKVDERPLLFSIIHDITRQHEAEEELKIAATAFDSQEGMFITTADTTILRVNRAFTEITGYLPEEVIGQKPHMLSSGRHDQGFYQAMWEQMAHEGRWQGEIWNRRKSGEIYPEWLTITAVRNDAGEIANYVATLMDISLRKATEEAINLLAFHDPLTRLPNRRKLNDRLGLAISASKRSRKHGALMFLDLDNFKPLNDTHGHNVGDMLLVEVAKRISACIRETDTVARFGGDEFVVLLNALATDQASSHSQAIGVAEKIRSSLAAPYLLTITPAGSDTTTTVEHHCTVSIGLVLFCGSKVSQENILKWADIAMYEAKHAGRNCITTYDPASPANP